MIEKIFVVTILKHISNPYSNSLQKAFTKLQSYKVTKLQGYKVIILEIYLKFHLCYRVSD